MQLENHKTFKERYGPLALIAGASKGLGAAFANALASEGFDLVLVARDPEGLESIAKKLTGLYAVKVWQVVCDLNDPDAITHIEEVIGKQMIHFVIYNAARSYIGPFLNQPVTEHLDIANVNILTPIKILHHFGGQMVKEKRGGVVLMSSLAGNQGSGFLATYAASKAFNRVLAESLWYEWKAKGVDVIGCIAGSILTPNFIQTHPVKVSALAPKPQLPEYVVKECFSRIGKTPSFISGGPNKIACFLMNRLLSVRKAVKIMGDTTRTMYAIKE